MTDDGRVHLAIGEFLDALRDLGVPLATTRTGRSYCQPDACGSHRPSQRFGTRPPRRGQPRDNGRGTNEFTASGDCDPWAATPWHKSVPARLER